MGSRLMNHRRFQPVNIEASQLIPKRETRRFVIENYSIRASALTQSIEAHWWAKTAPNWDSSISSRQERNNPEHPTKTEHKQYFGPKITLISFPSFLHRVSHQMISLSPCPCAFRFAVAWGSNRGSLMIRQPSEARHERGSTIRIAQRSATAMSGRLQCHETTEK